MITLSALDYYAAILAHASDRSRPLPKVATTTIARYTAPLVAAGYLVRGPGNGPYQLTDRGRTAFGRMVDLKMRRDRLDAQLRELLEPPPGLAA